MKFKVNRSKESAESIIRMNISMLINPIFLDITQGNSSQRILSMESEGKYLLFFSRPFLFNIFKLPLYDYEFKFSIEQSESPQESFIKGYIKPKRYIIGAVIAALMVFSYAIIEDITYDMKFSVLFYVCAPIYGIIYCSTGYLYFRRKIKKEISYLLRNK